MAGVCTDNQPDFSFLPPDESKSWSQYWYPIQQIGPARHANLNAAVNLVLGRKQFRVGVCVTRDFGAGVVGLERTDGSAAAEWRVALGPGRPVVLTSPQRRKRWRPGQTVLREFDLDGREIIAYAPQARVEGQAPPAATEPPLPQAIASADELYITGLHLEQYRHATRCPALYWREALRRGASDARCNNALGLWHLKRGEFPQAEAHFRKSIERLTRRNANPYDGEPYYNLGLCLRHLGRDDEAYAAFYKACWNQAWMAPGYHALAEIDCSRRDWPKALEHLHRSLRLNEENTRARNLKVLVLRRLHREQEAQGVLRETLRLDPLDWWARHLAGQPLGCDLQVALDLAHDCARGGFFAEAITLLESARSIGRDLPDQSWGALPLVRYTRGWLEQKRGDASAAQAWNGQTREHVP